MKISKLAQIVDRFHQLIILAEYVKPKEYWGKEAAGLLFICPEDSTVLLLLRSRRVMQGGTWGVYGGKVEKGEDAQQAAFREAEEELGSIPELESLIDTIKFEDTDSGFRYTTFVYSISLETKNSWQPELNWESDDFKWFPVDKLPGNVHFGVKHIMSVESPKLPKLKIFEKPQQFSNMWYHVTDRSRVEPIKREGLKVNSSFNKSMASQEWASKIYGMNPIYISKESSTYRGEILLGIDASKLKMVADIPGLIDYGANLGDDYSSLYFEEGEVPGELENFIDENGEISFADLMNSNSEVCKAAIGLTGTAAIMEDVSPEKIVVLGEV